MNLLLYFHFVLFVILCFDINGVHTTTLLFDITYTQVHVPTLLYCKTYFHLAVWMPYLIQIR